MMEFSEATQYYRESLSKGRIYVIGSADNDKALLSIAPLSAAAHSLSCDMYVLFKKPGVEAYKNVFKVWQAYAKFNSKKTIPSQDEKECVALAQFIKEVEKKAKGEFEPIFSSPDYFIFAMKDCFHVLSKEQVLDKNFLNAFYLENDVENLSFSGSKRLQYKSAWFKKRKWPALVETCTKIWQQVYALKPEERVGMGFELVPDPDRLTLPLADYLDSYAIIDAMKQTCPSQNVSLSAYTSRPSQLDTPEKTVELSATLLGCELEKDIDEPAFSLYKEMAKTLKFSRIQINDATFSIHGKGYSGKHIFGEKIGYPTPDKKSRWSSPGGIIYKFSWLPQTRHESRSPRTRIAFTETLPVEVFIQSCNIDWVSMREMNAQIMKRINSSDYIMVESDKTRLKVHLKAKDGKRRMPMPSSSDVRSKVNGLYLKQTGIKAGNMANIPGGEAFLTPEYLEGRFYGDVVISIDQSYVLDEPLVVDCDSTGYKIVKGNPKIIRTINEKKQEAMKLLAMMEKSASVPKRITDLSRKNFEKIGEFAINTNPSAQLCDYLIVNEKIAGMIHIALGSGFDDDRNTEYHYDIVINAKKQKLDIFGVKGENRIWIMKKGNFVSKIL